LQLTRIYIDAQHRPVDHLLGFYRPDRFQYHMHLTAPERKR
jgi:DNA-binding GntR family transcriptional regulator